MSLVGRAWFRTAALVTASLCVGGVATAVTGRLIARHRLDKVGRPVVHSNTNYAQAGRRQVHRWRVAVNAPAQLDLAVGPDGTELAVVKGRAEVSAADASGATTLVPGMSWRGVASDSEPPLPANVPNVPIVLNALPSPILPAPVPALGPRSPTPRGSQSTPRVPHYERKRTVAIAGPPRATHSSADVSLATPTSDHVAIELAPASLPNSSRFTVETPSPEAPRLAPGPLVSTPSSNAPATPRVSEAALLGRALRHLRSDHDPKGALAPIDEYDRRFPQGALKREATLARAEALLALERKASALAILDALKLEDAAVDRRVELARAELRAASGRRADAIADFDAVLKAGADDDIGARALFGRAVLRARAGDAAGARDDLREYLRHANSPRRNEAERALRRLGG